MLRVCRNLSALSFVSARSQQYAGAPQQGYPHVLVPVEMNLIVLLPLAQSKGGLVEADTSAWLFFACMC